MWGFVGRVAAFLWNWFQGLRGAPTPPVAQVLGQTQANLQTEATANDQLAKAAQARAAADAAELRSDPAAGEVHTDPAAAVNNLPGEQFRD